jgi:uncharacterized protein YggU (UPF0235/DUF167 family)
MISVSLISVLHKKCKMLYKVSVSFHLDYIKITGDQIEVGIMEEPVKGKANVAMMKKSQIILGFQDHK